MNPILLLLLLLVFLIFPVLQMWRQNKRFKEIRAFQAALEPGMRVQLTSGLHATVRNVEASSVELEIAPEVLTTWDRSAVLKSADSVPEA
ncbi:preprotein translocase subunit YajC [Corynebacterium heidelbergense]|uniref:Preprotein translocase subunit YajC n=1 Tax=Corynebacterium heidelbergense TaxID=2055947 RepID=A0A364VD95_9CORY|nr:preprotein translocase subunit YajC [Corynebacterium heidelbergense]RAV34600.1 preprotein translocase subunit YajC [Corynebacterium heidelbergense]WCZ36629.1 preprotein translocase subunit YajC [Corynebacterium heidelbergense]